MDNFQISVFIIFPASNRSSAGIWRFPTTQNPFFSYISFPFFQRKPPPIPLSNVFPVSLFNVGESISGKSNCTSEQQQPKPYSFPTKHRPDPLFLKLHQLTLGEQPSSLPTPITSTKTPSQRTQTPPLNHHFSSTRPATKQSPSPIYLYFSDTQTHRRNQPTSILFYQTIPFPSRSCNDLFNRVEQ